MKKRSKREYVRIFGLKSWNLTGVHLSHSHQITQTSARNVHCPFEKQSFSATRELSSHFWAEVQTAWPNQARWCWAAELCRTEIHIVGTSCAQHNRGSAVLQWRQRRPGISAGGQVPPRLTQNTKLRKRRTDLDVTMPQSMLCGGAEDTEGGLWGVFISQGVELPSVPPAAAAAAARSQVPSIWLHRLWSHGHMLGFWGGEEEVWQNRSGSHPPLGGERAEEGKRPRTKRVIH